MRKTYPYPDGTVGWVIEGDNVHHANKGCRYLKTQKKRLNKPASTVSFDSSTHSQCIYCQTYYAKMQRAYRKNRKKG